MEMTESKKNNIRIAITVLLIVVSLVYFFHPGINDLKFYSHDYQFHYYKSSGKEFKENEFISQEKLNAYAPLAGWLLNPFSFNLKTFYLATLIIFVLVMGLILTKLSNHWVAGLFWVSSSAPWFFLGGTIAQGLLTIFLIAFICVKKTKLRLALLALSLLLHSYGFWLLGAYWVIEILSSMDFKKIVLGICGTTFFPAKVGSNIQQTMELTTDTNLFGFKGLNMTSWVSVLRWFSLFPILPFGFLGLYKANKTLFNFSVIMFILSFVFLYWRVVETIMPFIVIGLTEYYKNSSKKMKVLLIALAFLLFVVQINNYFSVIQNIHLSATTLFLNLPCALGLK